VQETFGASGKERTLQMVQEIEAEMAKDIQAVPWMSNATRKQAIDKLHAVANKIGYPETWRDYSKVKIVRGEHLRLRILVSDGCLVHMVDDHYFRWYLLWHEFQPEL
jgi:predicted metalloendopeptidase